MKIDTTPLEGVILLALARFGDDRGFFSESYSKRVLADHGITLDFVQDNVCDWLYVEDHADACLLVAQKGQEGRSYNIGGENERTNLELVKTLCSILDDLKPRGDGKAYADQITFVTDRPGHDARYAIDPTRIRDEMGWWPSVTVEQGLRKAVEWYLANEDWWRALQTRDGAGVRLGVAV